MDELETYRRGDGWRIELPLAHVVHILKVDQAKEIRKALGDAIKSVKKKEAE
jgi:hypothetical protein